MWTAIFLLCSVGSQECYLTGPSTAFFENSLACETYAKAQISQLDLTTVNVTFKCVSWGNPL